MRILIHITISDAIRIEADVGIDSAPQRVGFVEPDDLEWRSCRGIQTELIRQWQHIENAESAAHRRFSILKRIPGESNSRLKVFSRGVVPDEGVYMLRSTRTAGAGSHAGRGAINQCRNFLNPVVSVSRQSCEFITQPQINCQVGTKTPIVVNISGEETLANSYFVGAAGRQSVEGIRSVIQEVGERCVIVFSSVRTQLFGDVVQHAFECKSDFNGMCAACKKSVIVGLRRSPAMQKAVQSPQPDSGRQHPRHADLRRPDRSGRHRQRGVGRHLVAGHRTVDVTPDAAQAHTDGIHQSRTENVGVLDAGHLAT